MSDIFLSYRRADEPGYVARLEDGLTNAFGEIVFRDVDSILVGEKWKLELQKEVSQAKVVIAVIGRRWQSILAERDPDSDQVRFELNLSHELEIPVMPLQIQGARINQEELGNLSWLNDLQIFEMSDRQNRWEIDLELLVESIVRLTQLERMKKNEQTLDITNIQVGEGLSIRSAKVGHVAGISTDTADTAKKHRDISVLTDATIENSELGDITGIKIDSRSSKDSN